MSDPERALARIDLGAIERNCAMLRSLLGTARELCAVVKADAYGHGAAAVAAAAQRGGASWLAVAAAGEAAQLRAGRHRGPAAGAWARSRAPSSRRRSRRTPTWSPGRASSPRQAAPRVHVKLDSGMGRLGSKDRPARARARAAAADRLPA